MTRFQNSRRYLTAHMIAVSAVGVLGGGLSGSGPAAAQSTLPDIAKVIRELPGSTWALPRKTTYDAKLGRDEISGSLWILPGEQFLIKTLRSVDSVNPEVPTQTIRGEIRGTYIATKSGPTEIHLTMTGYQVNTSTVDFAPTSSRYDTVITLEIIGYNQYLFDGEPVYRQ